MSLPVSIFYDLNVFSQLPGVVQPPILGLTVGHKPAQMTTLESRLQLPRTYQATFLVLFKAKAKGWSLAVTPCS